MIKSSPDKLEWDWSIKWDCFSFSLVSVSGKDLSNMYTFNLVFYVLNFTSYSMPYFNYDSSGVNKQTDCFEGDE